MRNYPESIFEGSTVPADKVPDVKFQPHGYLFLASEAGYDILKQNHDTQEKLEHQFKHLKEIRVEWDTKAAQKILNIF